ncbi:AraC family transcriptional regulator [Allorhizobium sp. BGMRC 0089]|uniref:AraC family transcriptional regulator n=1 Tax=Allorhizobium sonneratiae TaxID=2934936 RepID=UPI0020349778|nr:AraC family transcriptional regulator [Allorhizobium sonneratiae]MCM2294619.1 AraC family transcriptional regulator [Allorhizobium sonneratiae]
MSLSSAAVASVQRDGLGCSAHALGTDLEFSRPDFTLYRKGKASDVISQVLMPASDRGLLIGVSLRSGHQRRIFHGRASSSHGFAAGDVYLRNFDEDYKADLAGAFDFMLLEMTSSCLRQLAEEHHLPSGIGIRNFAGEQDTVLANLMHAMAPTLEARASVNMLFLDHVMHAIGVHLLTRYGDGQVLPEQVTRRGGRLSRQQERRARDLLMANMDNDISIAEVAAACGLSRSYFIRAFRETLGETPHRWLLRQRLERASDLVRHSDRSLAEVALACGFADQSHFNRHFRMLYGMTPGQMRRL